MDHWYAECIPCKWQEKHTTEDEAIAAAEKHVYANHLDVSGPKRAELKMGHVQNRSEGAVATEIPAVAAAEPLQPVVEASNAGGTAGGDAAPAGAAPPADSPVVP